MSEEAPLAVNWKKNLIFVGISQFLAMVGFGCCMPFIPLLMRNSLHIADDSVRGVFVSAYYFAGMISLCIATTVWGILADRFGRKIMLLRASYGAAIFYPMLAFAPNVWVLIAIRFFCSFFSGTVNPAQTLLVSTTPSDKHGFVLGTLSTSTWSGNMLGYLAGGLIVHYTHDNYKVAFLTCGVIYLISGLLVHIFAKEHFVRPTKTAADGKPAKPKYRFRDLATPAVIWLLVMFLLMGISRRIEQPFLAEQVRVVHGDDGAAFFTGIISAAAALGGVISGILIGHLCDRMAPRKLLIPILFISGLATVVQALAKDIPIDFTLGGVHFSCIKGIWVLIAARFFTYLAAGGLQPVLQVMLTKVTPPELKGTFFGWSGSVNTAGGIVCSFMSAGIAYTYGVRGIFLTAAALMFLMIPLTFPTVRACLKEYRCDPDATAKDLRENRA
ncbi:MAG: MFS transporter [Lentisphaeria bacterium]|nr:MFS transporter [Lentisphaeria bacterium]